MFLDWIKSNRWWRSREVDTGDTLWLQRQILNERYQDKKQNKSYLDQAKINQLYSKAHLT